MTSAREFGLQVEGTSGGEELVVCPFHADTKPSAWFNPRKELFYCAVCHLGLNAYQLRKRMGIQLDPDDYPEVGERIEPEDYDMTTAYDTTYELGEVLYHGYLSSRNITEHAVTHYGVRWKESSPQAVVLPQTNLDGMVVGVTYRHWPPTQGGLPRYRNVGTVTPVWPMHLLRYQIDPKLPILITEGAFSCMRLYGWAWDRGYHLNVLALMGAKAKKATVDVLQRFKCIFLYDSDEAGKYACLQMRKMFPSARAWTLSVSPDDMDEKQLGNLMIKIKEKGI